MTLTPRETMALLALRDSPHYPDELYPIIFSCGRFNSVKDHGSSKGGPSKREYAVNMYMGRLAKKGLVSREPYLSHGNKLAGQWYITGKGKQKI